MSQLRIPKLAPPSDRWFGSSPQVEALLDRVLEQPDDQQLAWLRAQVDHYPAELIAEVGELLESLLRHDQTLEQLTPLNALAALESSQELQVDQRVAGWRIESLIASGGQGSVYRARRSDVDFEQVGALKVLNNRLAEPTALRRFQRERQLLANLDHPGIPTLLDGGVLGDGSPWLVTEFVTGQTLADKIAQQPLATDRAVALGAQLCRILAHAHRQLIAHLDLKPSNVMLDDEGHLRLLDFGIARLLDGDTMVLTGPAYTPAFAAPEQVNQAQASTASDIYGVGALLLAALTARAPFSADDVAGLLQQVLNKEPDIPSTVAPDLGAIVRRCMRKDPAQRYPTVEAVLDDLDAFAAGRPVAARSGGWRYRLGKLVGRHRVATVATALLLIMSVMAAAVYVRQQDQVRQQRDRAQVEAERANSMVDFLESSLSVLDLARQANPSLSTFLESTAARTGQITDDVARARLLMMLAMAIDSQGDYENAMALVRSALPLIEATELRDGLHHVNALTALAGGEIDAGRMASGETLARQAMAIAEDQPDRVPGEYRLSAVGQLAWTLMEQDKTEDLRQLLGRYLPAKEAVQTGTDFEKYGMLAIMAGNIAESPQEKYALARELYDMQQSFPDYARYAIRETVILGRRALALGRLTEALGLFQQAEATVRANVDGEPLTASYAMIQQAAVHRMLGEFEPARAALQRAAPLVAKQGLRLGHLLTAQQVLLDADAGRVDQAGTLLKPQLETGIDERSSAGEELAAARTRWLWASGALPAQIKASGPQTIDGKIAGLKTDCNTTVDERDLAPPQPSLAQRVLGVLQAACSGEPASAQAQALDLEARLHADHWMVQYVSQYISDINLRTRPMIAPADSAADGLF